MVIKEEEIKNKKRLSFELFRAFGLGVMALILVGGLFITNEVWFRFLFSLGAVFCCLAAARLSGLAYRNYDQDQLSNKYLANRALFDYYCSLDKNTVLGILRMKPETKKDLLPVEFDEFVRGIIFRGIKPPEVYYDYEKIEEKLAQENSSLKKMLDQNLFYRFEPFFSREFFFFAQREKENIPQNSKPVEEIKKTNKK